MSRSGRIRRSGGGGSLRHGAMCLLSSLLLLLLRAPASALALMHASGYDEALARRMIVYCSIAISDPEQVDAWTFPNPCTCCFELDVLKGRVHINSIPLCTHAQSATRSWSEIGSSRRFGHGTRRTRTYMYHR